MTRWSLGRMHAYVWPAEIGYDWIANGRELANYREVSPIQPVDELLEIRTEQRTYE
jgi:hypothetical protein